MYHFSKTHLALPLLVLGALLVLPGCAQRNAPHMGFGSLNIEAQIGREDIVILDRVEGSSSTTSILLNLIRIIDGDKLQLFGIKFFKDKYVWKEATNPLWAYLEANTESRAYYKALEAHPEADAVFSKNVEREETGLPFLFHTETVTYKGKAIKLRADQ